MYKSMSEKCREIKQIEKEVREVAKAYVPWAMFVSFVILLSTVIGWLITTQMRTGDKVDDVNTKVSNVDTKLEVITTKIGYIENAIRETKISSKKSNIQGRVEKEDLLVRLLNGK